MPRKHKPNLANCILRQVDDLARISAHPEFVVRDFLSAEHRAAADLITQWMREAGMGVRIDAAGTVIGRIEGRQRDAKKLLVGSNIGSFNNSGRFAGVLGVLTSMAALQRCKDEGVDLPYAVEVVCFGDLDGRRFGQAMTGSRVMAGLFVQSSMTAVDSDGVTLPEALRAFGGDPDGLKSAVADTGQILGYIEVSIEQGPVLAYEKLPVGVVTAISGASSYNVVVSGEVGHAGTVPMNKRRDALAAAAEMINVVEGLALGTAGLTATVGRIDVVPGLPNVVPGRVEFSIDARSPIDRMRRAAVREIERALKGIARKRRVGVAFGDVRDVKAVACDHRFIRHFSEAIERAGLAAFGMPSGAGHDGLAMAHLCPVGMLFVRSRVEDVGNGVETVSAEDIECAVSVLADFLKHASISGRTIA